MATLQRPLAGFSAGALVDLSRREAQEQLVLVQIHHQVYLTCWQHAESLSRDSGETRRRAPKPVSVDVRSPRT